jgi:hypothetical protein
MAICSGSNIWDNRMSFCSVLYWNQLWLSFGVNVEIKVFPRKVNSRVRSFSYSKMNTLLFLCIFTFRVDWNVCFFVENEKYLCLSERRQTICGSFKINTTSWVLHSQCKNACVLFILTMICFAFDGKNDRCWIVLAFWDTFNIEIDCSVMRLSCLDELLNNYL